MARSTITSTESKPLLVEVLAYAPTQFFHCQHCEFIWHEVGAATSPHAPGEIPGNRRADSLGERIHQEQLESSIPQDLQKEYADLSQWVREAVETYGGRVVFKVIDAASMEGLLKSVRYGARRYPAFIINRQEKYIGTDFDRAKRLIDTHVQIH